MPPTLCRCGHPRPVHEHYRRGSDCGICGDVVCPGWAVSPWWRRWIHRNCGREAERLRAEVARLSGDEQTLRNVIALHPYNPPNPGPAA